MKHTFLIAFYLFVFCSNYLSAQINNAVEIAHPHFDYYHNIRDFCISDEQDEIFFTVQSPFQELSRIVFMTKENGNWLSPQLMPFSSQFTDMEPFLSPDQKRLYFASNRPLNPIDSTVKDFDIWYVERSDKNKKWSEPINIGSPVNTKNDEFYPSLSSNNNLYFTSDSPNGMGKDDIYFCVFENETFSTPQLLDSNINSSGYEFNAFISRNENFLIFTKYNSTDGLGSGDLYISKKDKHNQWTKAQNLGSNINTKFMEYCPYYDEARKTLYFTSKRNSLQNQNFEDFEHWINYLHTSENGLSKIYKVDFEVEK